MQYHDEALEVGTQLVLGELRPLSIRCFGLSLTTRASAVPAADGMHEFAVAAAVNAGSAPSLRAAAAATAAAVAAARRRLLPPMRRLLPLYRLLWLYKSG